MKYLLILMTALVSLTANAGTLQQSNHRALIAYMEVKPGSEQAYLDLAKVVIAASRQEPGNISYQLHQSLTNPQMFVFYELFESDEDLQSHRNAPHTQAFLSATKPFTTKFILEEYAPLNEAN